MNSSAPAPTRSEARIPSGDVWLDADLVMPPAFGGVVLFAHGGGSGRHDLAGPDLPAVTAATLLIVGGADYGVIELNEDAYQRLRCEKELVIVSGATHLFEEPGALERVADTAASWFSRHMASVEHPA